MFKITQLPLALAIVAVATPVLSFELYQEEGYQVDIDGRVEGIASIINSKVKDKSRARLGLLGQVEISESLTALGRYQGEYTTADHAPGEPDDDTDHRYVFVGLDGNFGKVTYGKNDAAIENIASFTDLMAYHGNNAAYRLTTAGRVDNLLGYQGSYVNVDFQANYRFADRVESSAGIGDNDVDGYSFSGIYNLSDYGLKLGTGYAKQHNGANQSEFQTILAGAYQFDQWQFATTIVRGELSDSGTKTDKTGYEVAAQVTVDKTVVSASYNHLVFDTATLEIDKVHSVAMDLAYYFKPNFRGYVSYNHNLLDQDANKQISALDAESETIVGMHLFF